MTANAESMYQADDQLAYNRFLANAAHTRGLAIALKNDLDQVTDALITHEVAARQRGSAVLGAAGHKLTHTMTLPLLTGGSNPGLIQPGYLIEVNDIGHTWRGLVRGIRVTAGLPTVRQTITVEREAVTP